MGDRISFPDIFIPRLDSQTDQNASIRPKSAVLWPDVIVGLYGATKQSVVSAYLEDLKESLLMKSVLTSILYREDGPC